MYVGLIMLNNVVEIAQIYMRLSIKKGATVLDATCGNGYDTVLLSDLTGISGKVLAFDVQQVAISRTEERLKKNNCCDNVRLICDSHEHLADYTDSISFAVFNLGYLPNSDKSVTTKACATLRAVKTAISILTPGGLIVICCYLGHPGGAEEYESLVAELNHYDCDRYNIVLLKHLIRHEDAPRIILIEKK